MQTFANYAYERPDLPKVKRIFIKSWSNSKTLLPWSRQSLLLIPLTRFGITFQPCITLYSSVLPSIPAMHFITKNGIF